MAGGLLVKSGAPLELLAQPRSEFSAMAAALGPAEEAKLRLRAAAGRDRAPVY
jgi:hypothetical protein